MKSDEELKNKLIKQMGSQDNAEALQAVEKLRQRGWLQDGSLCGVKLDEANLYNADLHAANMNGANLSKANLNKADLSGVDLSGANLSGAFIIAAELHVTYLSKADLGKVNFFGSALTNANLNEANLCKADLESTILVETRVHNADFTDARCSFTVFSNINLSTVKGLAKVRHGGPSSIDIHTLYISKGQIPDVFLRGCGMPENLIIYHRSLIDQAIDFYPAFISYSHKDLAFAQRVYATLQGKGIRCWLDVHQIKPGHEIWDEIARGIRYWDKTILCCSKHSLTSDWVDNELDNLFAKERRIREQLRKHQRSDPDPVRLLIPLDLDGYVFSEEYQSGKKEYILSRNVADFTDWKTDSDKFEQEIEKVVAFLRPDEGREPPPPSLLSR